MSKISATAMEASLEALASVAKEYGVSIDKAGGIHLALLKRTATERSEPEVREASKVLIKKIFDENPFAEFDPAEVAERSGLKRCQADKAFTRHVLKVLRLGYNPGPGHAAPAE